MIRRQGERIRPFFEAIAKEGESPATLWQPDLNIPSGVFEFLALATKREAVRAKVSRFMQEFREARAEAVALRFRRKGIEPAVPPLAISTILTSVSQTLALESAIGVTSGHTETCETFEAWLDDMGKRTS